MVTANGKDLKIRVHNGLENTGETREVSFRPIEYAKLRDLDKERLDKILQENIGKTIEDILNLPYESEKGV